MSEWKTVTLGDFLKPVVEEVSILDTVEYKRVTVHGRGRGLSLRDTATGGDIGTKRQYRIRAGQWLVARYDIRNGAHGLVPDALDGAVVTQHFPTFAVDADMCDPRYLILWASRPAFWEECELISEGSTNRSRIDPALFLEIEASLPPLDVQRAVVAAATALGDQVEAVRAEADAGFALLTAATEHAVGVNAGEWPSRLRRPLMEVASVSTGITKGRRISGPASDVPYLVPTNVRNGFLDVSEIKMIPATEKEQERFAVLPGDVLIVGISGTPDRLGRGWIWQGEMGNCLFQNSLFRLRADTSLMDPRFLAYILSAAPARRYFLEIGGGKTTSGAASINKTEISDAPIVAPPVAEQQKIVAMLDGLRQAAIAALREAHALAATRSLLLNDLLSGARALPEPLLGAQAA